MNVEPQVIDIPRRFSLQYLFEETKDVLVCEKGFLYTFKELLLRPGKTVHRVLSFVPGKLSGPMKFVSISVALVALYMNLARPVDSMSTTQSQQMDGVEASQELEALSSQLRAFTEDSQHSAEARFRANRAVDMLETSMLDWINGVVLSWFNVLLLAAIPVFALLSWCLLRRSMNMAEHLAIHAMVYGAQCVLTILVIVPFQIVGQANVGSVVYLLCSLVYQLFAWKQVFHLQSLLDWLRCLTLLIATYVFYMLVVILFIGAIIVSQIAYLR